MPFLTRLFKGKSSASQQPTAQNFSISYQNHKQHHAQDGDHFESYILTRTGDVKVLMSLPFNQQMQPHHTNKRKRPNSMAQGLSQYQGLEETLTVDRFYDDDALEVDVDVEMSLDSDGDVEVEGFGSGAVELNVEIEEGWEVVLHEGATAGPGDGEVKTAASDAVRQTLLNDDKSIEDWEVWWRESAGVGCTDGRCSRGGDAAVDVKEMGEGVGRKQMEEVEERKRCKGDEMSVEDWEGWWRVMAERGGL